jgi:ankyrin repeat protein
MNQLIITTILWLAALPSSGPATNPKADFLAAITAGKVTEAREMLNATPSLAKASAPNGTSAILFALYHRQPEIAALLLPFRRADLTVFESAALGETARLHTLLRQDPELANAVSVDGFTPLHLASFFGQTGAQQMLIHAGAMLETHSKNQLNATSLQSAVASHQLTSAAVLLAHHADPNCRGEAGYTPLFEAAESGQVEVVILLLKHGADPSIKGTDGKTALDVAVKSNRANIEEILSKGRVYLWQAN